MNILQRRAVLKNANYLNLTPVRLMEEEVGTDNLVVLLLPRFTSNFAKKYIVPRLKRAPHIRLKLDQLGSASWLAIDGKRKVGEIAVELQRTLNSNSSVEVQQQLPISPSSSIEDIESRLTRFLTLLYEQKIITFAEVQD
jgi:hypothetical protein